MAKILCLIDSFKGSLSSQELGQISKEVLSKKGHNVTYIPISDGGDGFLDSIEHLIQLTRKKVTVLDPNNHLISADYLYDPLLNVAYIEMAQSSGINLIDIHQTSIFDRSTYGLGELISASIDSGIKQLYVGLGGSATNDGGAGMLSQMGLKFIDKYGQIIQNISPKDFLSIDRIDTKEFLKKYKDIEITLLSDVENPLLGTTGSSYVFGPQKGLDKGDIIFADNLMKHYAQSLETAFKIRTHDQKGAGAAGGVGFALMTACHAKYQSGIDTILSHIHMDEAYDYVITGEGKIDQQSLNGKVILGVIKKFKQSKIILVAGKNDLSQNEIDELKIDSVYDIIGKLNITLKQSLSEPKKYFKQLIELIDLNQ